MDELLHELRLRQRRYSRQEKHDFVAFLQRRLDALGLSHRVWSARFPKSIHLETVPEGVPDVILVAHYDTATVLPFWCEWLIRLTGHTRSALTLVVVLAVFQALSYLPSQPVSHALTVAIALSVLVPMLFVPNKTTMNDNTSGVLALLLLAERLSRDEELRRRVKLVFTDNEEKMLLGSFQLRRLWGRNGCDYRKARIISLDSLGRGDCAVITYNMVDETARQLTRTFEGRGMRAKAINMWMTPFSDAFPFWRTGAVNVNMMSRTLIPGGFFIEGIHSPRDREISRENVGAVVDAVEEYIRTYARVSQR
jgi:hypothetical protein